MRTRTTLLALLLAAGAVTACGGDDDEPAAGEAADPTETTEAATPDTTGAAGAAGGTEVVIERSRFEPDELEVPAGTEVTWTNVDPFTHTVTAADDSPLAFDSGDLAQDATFSQAFAEPGTYEYFCQVHPTMRSTVVVVS